MPHNPFLYFAVLIAFLSLTCCPTRCFAQADTRNAMRPADDANPLDRLIPGEEFQPDSVRAKQADDFDNPGFALVDAADFLWAAKDGASGKSCQSCHRGGSMPNSIKLASASYPKFDDEAGGVISLSERINMCRIKNMQALPWRDGSAEMNSMVAYLRSLARGSSATVDISAEATSMFERGKWLYDTKLGLLQISCTQCHDKKFGQKFGAETLSQGHPLAYPVYKISEKRLVSLHERFRMCYKLARAEPLPENSPNYTALELYLAWRSKPLPISAPGVRP